MNVKYVCGVGKNDIKKAAVIEYLVQVEGYIIEVAMKLYAIMYNAWVNLLSRSNSEKYHQSHPTYIGVTVCDEWLLFSNFVKWFAKNYIGNYQLDKDLLKQNNLQYSPDACRYVPTYVNSVLLDCGASRGVLPIGVTIRGKYFKAQCSQLQNDGSSKNVYLGYFGTSEKAHAAWQRGKIKAIEIVIEKYKTEPMPLPEIISALELRIQKLRDDIKNGCETKKL